VFEVRDGPQNRSHPLCVVSVSFSLARYFLHERLLHLPDEVGNGLKVFGRLLIGFITPDGDGVGDIREELLMRSTPIHP